MAVITLSRELGSGGLSIAQQVAQKLSWRLIDKELIIKASELANCSESQVEKFDQEQFDQMKVLFSDLAFPIPGSGMMYPFVAAGYMEPYWYPSTSADQGSIDESKYLQLTKTVIQNFADEGKVIIVGRGGCVLLKDYSNTFHVRIVAPMDQRIQRVMESGKVDESTAKKMISHRDKASAEYLKHFYQEDWANPAHYHLVINTGKISLDQAVDLLVNNMDMFIAGLKS